MPKSMLLCETSTHTSIIYEEITNQHYYTYAASDEIQDEGTELYYFNFAS